jgi:hypothetical protein
MIKHVLGDSLSRLLGPKGSHRGRYASNCLALCGLAFIAAIYYGSFYNYSFNLADEGSVALITERLANGETPYLDIEIGYGILWYLPIVLLFKVFGTEFYLIRLYFLAIGFASALLAYGVMVRLTGNRVIAFAVALVILLFPGVTYQTYIPFLVISGLYVLLLYDVRTLRPTVPAWVALTCSGVYLAAAYLIRPDIATAFTVLIGGYHVLLAVREAIQDRGAGAIRGLSCRLLAITGVAILVTLPFVFEAKERGFLDDLMQRYWIYAEQLILKSAERLARGSPADTSSTVALLPRLPPQALFWPDHRGFAFLTYAPVISVASILLFLAGDFLRRVGSGAALSAFIADRTYLLVLSGAALSTFPQFFIWRPDLDHLCGFFPGFALLLAYSLFLLWRASKVATNRVRRRATFGLLGVFLTTYVVIFAVHFDGLNLRHDRDFRLRLDKGIDVNVTWLEFQTITQLHSAVTRATQPGDYVLCFPYCPGINFITDRPTFQHFLYVDEGVLRANPGWIDDMKAQIVARKPKVIVIQNWAVNGTELSRFQNWARPLYTYVTEAYARTLELRRFEVFVLKDTIPGSSAVAKKP